MVDPDRIPQASNVSSSLSFRPQWTSSEIRYDNDNRQYQQTARNTDPPLVLVEKHTEPVPLQLEPTNEFRVWDGVWELCCHKLF